VKKGDRGPLIVNVQQELSTLGIDPGPVDGIAGNQVFGAINTFAAVHGLAQVPVGYDFVGDSLLSAIAKEYFAFAAKRLRFLDVSLYQRDLRCKEIVASGVRGIFVKASEGLALTDPYFQRDWQDAKAEGLYRGAYHFFRPYDDPILQARQFARAMGELGERDLPPALDVERPDPPAPRPPDFVARVVSCLREIERLTKRKPLLYTYWAYACDRFKDAHELAEWPLWLAYYPPVKEPPIPFPWRRFTFWQTSGTAHSPGVDGAVDTDLFNGDEAALLQFIANSRIS